MHAFAKNITASTIPATSGTRAMGHPLIDMTEAAVRREARLACQVAAAGVSAPGEVGTTWVILRTPCRQSSCGVFGQAVQGGSGRSGVRQMSEGNSPHSVSRSGRQSLPELRALIGCVAQCILFVCVCLRSCCHAVACSLQWLQTWRCNTVGVRHVVLCPFAIPSVVKPGERRRMLLLNQCNVPPCTQKKSRLCLDEIQIFERAAVGGWVCVSCIIQDVLTGEGIRYFCVYLRGQLTINSRWLLVRPAVVCKVRYLWVICSRPAHPQTSGHPVCRMVIRFLQG